MILNLFNTQKFLKEEEKEGEIPQFNSVASRVLKIVLPAMIEAILVSLAVMADGVMVSVIGNEANAAVAITKQPIYFMICFITALNIAVTTIVARRKGQKDTESANKTMHTGLVLSAILGIVITIFMGLLSRPICLLMGAESDTVDLATIYLRINAFGFIFNALRLTINAAQRGAGNTFISMITNVIANIVNVFLNYCLITGKFGFPALGIAGAAYATVIGNAVAFFISFAAIAFNGGILKLNFKNIFKPDKGSYVSVLRIFPSAMIEQAFMRVGFILFAVIVNNLGTSETYVNGLCSDVNTILFAISDGFAIGTSAIVGHRLGEKRRDLAIVYARVSLVLSFCTSIIFCVIMLSVRKNVISLYNPDTVELANKAANILILAAVMALPQTIQWVLTGVLRGAGDTKYTATTSMISIMILRPIISFVLCYLTPLGLYGAWLGMIIDQSIRCTANIWRFKSRKWINIRV